MSSRAPNPPPVRANTSNGASTPNKNGAHPAEPHRSPSRVVNQDFSSHEDSSDTAAHLPTDLADWLHHSEKGTNKAAG